MAKHGLAKPPTAAAAQPKTMGPVLDIIYWKTPLTSVAALSIGLLVFLLTGVHEYSSVSVVCYALTLNLLVRLVHNHGWRALAEMNVMPKREVPAAPETFVTEEQVQARVADITSGLNSVLGASYSMLCGECTPAVGKSLAVLFALALSVRILGSTGLCFVAFVSAFTLPKGYEKKRVEVDAVAAKVKARVDVATTTVMRTVGETWGALVAKVPKAADLNKSGAVDKKKAL